MLPAAGDEVDEGDKREKTDDRIKYHLLLHILLSRKFC